MHVCYEADIKKLELLKEGILRKTWKITKDELRSVSAKTGLSTTQLIWVSDLRTIYLQFGGIQFRHQAGMTAVWGPRTHPRWEQSSLRCASTTEPAGCSLKTSHPWLLSSHWDSHWSTEMCVFWKNFVGLGFQEILSRLSRLTYGEGLLKTAQAFSRSWVVMCS